MHRVSSPLDKVKAVGQSQGDSTEVKQISFLAFFLKMGFSVLDYYFDFSSFWAALRKGAGGKSPRSPYAHTLQVLQEERKGRMAKLRGGEARRSGRLSWRTIWQHTSASRVGWLYETTVVAMWDHRWWHSHDTDKDTVMTQMMTQSWHRR